MKDRDPMKARKRAKNDAGTALRKLAQWAHDLGLDGAERDILASWQSIKAMAEKLEQIQARRDACK